VVFPSQILIIEAEEQLAENLKSFLGRCVADVRIAPNADAAMAILKSFTPDLVILDYAPPGVDGLRAYDRIIRTNPNPLRCVLITCDPTEAIAECAQQQGIRQVLCKPFSFAQLQHAVNTSMGESGDAAMTEERRVNERRSYRILWCHTKRRQTWSRRKQPDDTLQGLRVDPGMK